MSSLGKFKIFTYVKPSATATMFSHRISEFLSEQLDRPITWNDDVGKKDLDTLIIVAGGVPFCQALPALGKAVLRSERIIYCQNDYVSRLPTITSHGKSPYRAAFRLRHKRGMKPVDFWSTIESHSLRSPGSCLINWNLLAYQETLGWPGDADKTLLYYGSWRPKRIPTFDHWFKKPYDRTLVLNNSGRFLERYPRCKHGESTRATLSAEMHDAGLGLYIEDPISHAEFTQPACRFYEMLGAGLPMIFEPKSVPMLKRAGFDVENYVVEGPKDVGYKMNQRGKIAREQADWRDNFKSQLIRQLRSAL